jgi:hypothetical protein
VNRRGYHPAGFAGWDDRSTITLVGPQGQEGFAANIVVTRQGLNDPSVELFADQQLSQLNQEAERIEVLKERTTNINGNSAFQRHHILHIGQYRVQQIQSYLVREIGTQATGFVITCSASASDFPEHLPAFNHFTEHFRFFDPESVALA